MSLRVITMNSNPAENEARFNTVKGDKEIADELRKRFFECLEPICKLIAEADSHGFEVGFGFGKDVFGKTQIQHINLMKKY